MSIINVQAVRKEIAAKSSDLQKQKRDHEKRVRDHEKRLTDLKDILDKSQRNAADLKAKIEAALIDGGDVADLKEKLHSEELNVQAYTGAIQALGYAIDRENELLRGIDNSLVESDKEELNCKLIETARVYNKQAAEMAKTLKQLGTLVEEVGSCEKVKCIYTGYSAGVSQVCDGSIITVFQGIKNMPIIYIKDSDGEKLSADLSNESSRQKGMWNHYPILTKN